MGSKVRVWSDRSRPSPPMRRLTVSELLLLGHGIWPWENIGSDELAAFESDPQDPEQVSRRIMYRHLLQRGHHRKLTRKP
ncbi:hypothetical protein HYPDE_26783 [Hyphomicrobium denitrificans 1NES1]|uniref:Uncharacterized protein n=1 Tax=Hyphomicrobium denitrificans 1NES1 TaxID=670307 RepID=N0B4B5_9HYPH|nr:hypothetical protein HYPDE_26783 [Hyphomicrobium denitrificans 1NES1]